MKYYGQNTIVVKKSKAVLLLLGIVIFSMIANLIIFINSDQCDALHLKESAVLIMYCLSILIVSVYGFIKICKRPSQVLIVDVNAGVVHLVEKGISLNMLDITKVTCSASMWVRDVYNITIVTATEQYTFKNIVSGRDKCRILEDLVCSHKERFGVK
jgi:hypothetical protein